MTESALSDSRAVALALESLAECRVAIDEIVGDLMGRSTTLEERARIGDACDQLRAVAAQASAWANDRLVAAMNARSLDRLDEVEGLPAIERHASKARKGWDSEALRSSTFGRLYRRAADAAAGGDVDTPPVVDPATGERVPGWADAVAAIGEVWNLSGNNVRVTAVKDLGLDPDEYCTPGKTSWSLRYVRADD